MICLNELSFVGQVKSWDEVKEVMRAFNSLISSLISVLRDNDVVTHSAFYDAEISNGLTVRDWIKSIPITDKQVLRTLLLVTTKGPFIDLKIAAAGVCDCSIKSKKIAYRSLAGAAHFQGRSASLQGAGSMSDATIPVQYCGGETRHIENFTTVSQLKKISRTYAPTNKHTPWGWGTTMDLDNATAQRVLDAGIVDGAKIFGFCQGKYYLFRTDNAGGFHGYPVDVADVPNAIVKQLSQAIQQENLFEV